MKNKFDVFETFKKWKAMVETETCLKVKCLRLDNGGEYIDGGFSKYYATQGIRIKKTILGTPQQNAALSMSVLRVRDCMLDYHKLSGLMLLTL